jgi:hypothetical protein
MEKFRSEMEKSRSGIQDKHPGSATLDTKSHKYEKKLSLKTRAMNLDLNLVHCLLGLPDPDALLFERIRILLFSLEFQNYKKNSSLSYIFAFYLP